MNIKRFQKFLAMAGTDFNGFRILDHLIYRGEIKMSPTFVSIARELDMGKGIVRPRTLGLEELGILEIRRPLKHMDHISVTPRGREFHRKALEHLASARTPPPVPAPLPPHTKASHAPPQLTEAGACP